MRRSRSTGWRVEAERATWPLVTWHPHPLLRRLLVTSPLLRLPDDELCHVFNLIRIPASGADADRLVAANRAGYERIRAAGGTLYPVSALPMSGEDWRAHFGPAFGLLDDAKRVHDPRHVLTPGYEIY